MPRMASELLKWELLQVGQIGEMAQEKITIDVLPDEVLVMIMGSLPTEDLIQCSMVCHRWQRLTTEETLWRTAKIKKYTVIPLKTLAKLIQRGIRSFHLKDVVISDPDSWSRIFSPPTYTSEVTFLDLTEAGMSEKAFQCLLKPMSRLQELRVGSVNFRLDRDCCAAIAKNKQLRILNLSEIRVIDNIGLKKILNNCQRLESLDLSETGLNRLNLDLISLKLPASLLRLNLRNCGLLFSDEHLSKIVKLCPNLTHLDISANRFLTHAAAEATASLRNLEELKNDQGAYDSDDDDWGDDWSDDESDVFEFMSDSNSSDFSDVSTGSYHVPLGLLMDLDHEFHSSSSDSSFVNMGHSSNDDADSDIDLSESSDHE